MSSSTCTRNLKNVINSIALFLLPRLLALIIALDSSIYKNKAIVPTNL